MSGYGPEDIRKLRGRSSRAAFARSVGVTPLTVYRWELPDGSPEARRPRGRVLERLRSGVPVLAHTAPDADLLPHLQPPDLVGVRAAEAALFGRLAAGDPPPIALATLASYQLNLHGDTRAAMATLAPALAAADRDEVDPATEVTVRAMASAVFAQADGLLFDPDRVDALARRVEALLDAGVRAPLSEVDLRFIVRGARLAASFNMGDFAAARRLSAETAALCDRVVAPVNRVVVGEVRGVAALLEGNSALAIRRFEEAVAGSRDLPVWQARALALLALRQLDDAQDPVAVLTRVRSALAIQREARIADGFHSIQALRVEGESLVRLGRFAEAEASMTAADAVTASLRWTPIALHHTWARIYLATGRVDALRALGLALSRWEGRVQVTITQAAGAVCIARADLAAGLADGVAERIEGVLDALARSGGWPFLEREAHFVACDAALAAGRLDAAERALGRLDRHLDHLPSAWYAAMARRVRGLLRWHQGRAGEGRQLLESALAGFTLAGDLPEAATTRRLLALHADDAGALRASDAELAQLGMVVQAPLLTRPPLVPAAEPATTLGLPIERLALRGVGPGHLHRELVTVVAALLPGASVTLEAVDPSPVRIEEAGPPDLPADEWYELADGAGGRLRLGLGGPLTEVDRADVRALLHVASLALEVAVLRGYAQATPSETETVDAPGVVAASPAMRRLVGELGRLAASRATVIVTGESGSGKEVIARALHHLSARRDGPFVAFNCAAVPRELFEGQLFGARRGAYTGAVSDQPGVIRGADGGTLFLDEVGELPLDVQPKLLRFLENGEVLPLGERRPVRVDARVVAATHRDLGRLVREGRFREDLYYRLQVVPLRVPPLRERRDDILALARHFVVRYTPDGAAPPTLSADAVGALLAWPWPGNVRELRNVIERAMAYAPPPPVLTAAHLHLGEGDPA